MGKKYKYVYYKLMPVLTFAEAELEEDLTTKICRNLQAQSGILFVDIDNEKNCKDWKVPTKLIWRKGELYSIEFIEEVKEEEIKDKYIQPNGDAKYSPPSR